VLSKAGATGAGRSLLLHKVLRKAGANVIGRSLLLQKVLRTVGAIEASQPLILPGVLDEAGAINGGRGICSCRQCLATQVRMPSISHSCCVALSVREVRLR
jgi:hypothetical protein